MGEPSLHEIARSRLRHLGVVLQLWNAVEYRVNYAGGKEADWAYFDVLGDAITHGEGLAALRPLQPPVASKRRGRGKPVYRTARPI
jgi:hypothetical protein